MRRYIALILILVLSTGHAFALTDKWHLSKSRHFILHYKSGQEYGFLEHVIEEAEKHYDQIADNLGFRRFDFWLWDDRAKIYIYRDAAEYQEATGQPKWSAGCAEVRSKIIHTYYRAKRFFDTLLPHELGHIIFREFVGFDNRAVPIWLDEGVASYQGRPGRGVYSMIIKKAVKEESFLDIKALAEFDPHRAGQSGSVDLFYAEAASIVDFMISKFGKDKFVYFCQNLRDKPDLEWALSSAYGFRDAEELGEAWQEYLGI
ncbi:peptidase MA family metallohydrolase [Candidatus Omnitrophota bacterium]